MRNVMMFFLLVFAITSESFALPYSYQLSVLSDFQFQPSTDGTPPGNLPYLLSHVTGDKYGIGEGIHLNQVAISDWLGSGAVEILAEEFAGNKGYNAFGWYYTNNSTALNQVFSGSIDPSMPLINRVSEFTINSAQYFGFYLKSGTNPPVYSNSDFNSGSEKSLPHVAIFQVLENPDTYIMGWEDLAMNSTDHDYQDMVVSVRVKYQTGYLFNPISNQLVPYEPYIPPVIPPTDNTNSVPEPSSRLLLCISGLLLASVVLLKKSRKLWYYNSVDK